MSTMRNYAELASELTDALSLSQAPVAVCLRMADSVPPGLPSVNAPAAAGCVFWERGRSEVFATTAADHGNCAIGTFTHNLDVDAAHESERRDALAVFADLGYVRAADIPFIPVLRESPRHVVYAPLAETPVPPDVVLLFVNAAQALILAEAAQALEEGMPPAMGRPACAVIPQVANTGRSAMSLGCCGARAYLDVLSDDVALWALPGSRLAEYAERIGELARANATLSSFHTLRRQDVAAGRTPTIKESLRRLG
jgi:uncharacterized protein (DUF169 family)